MLPSVLPRPFKARSLGFDRSMVAGYGQDDRVCAYSELRAILNIYNPKKTAVCILSDKEEIGSMGNTGMESHVFDTFVAELLNKRGENRPNLLDKVFCNSRMLSSDVDAALDPIYLLSLTVLIVWLAVTSTMPA